MEFCLLLLGLGYLHGANISLKFLIRLKMVLNILAGCNFLRESSLFGKE